MSSHDDEETIVENFDWNRLSLERLKLLQSKICKAIDRKRGELKLVEHLDRESQVYNYKVNLAKVFPARLRGSLSDYSSCVLIVSLGSKNFVDGKRLEACIQWIGGRFQVCAIFVCDSIYRLTVEIGCGLKGREAWLEALQVGREFVEKNRSRFERYDWNCRFEYKFASEIAKRSDFEIYYGKFQELHRNNKSFQSTIDTFARTYLDRGDREGTECSDDFEQKQLAIAYLLEESALFACLAQEGWPVFVYPGSLKAFEEISEGLHPEVPTPLQQIIWASVRLKKRNVASG